MRRIQEIRQFLANALGAGVGFGDRLAEGSGARHRRPGGVENGFGIARFRPRSGTAAIPPGEVEILCQGNRKVDER